MEPHSRMGAAGGNWPGGTGNRGWLPAGLGENARLRRRRSPRLVAGVGAGIADHLNVPVLGIRATFAVLAAFNGAGILAYGLLWIFVPQGSAEQPASAKERQQGLGLIVVGIGLATAVGLVAGFPGWMFGPLAVVTVGAGLVWWEADESQRRRWRAGARSGFVGIALGGGRWSVVRIVTGIVLVIIGYAVFLAGNTSLSDVRFALLSVVAALVGAAVLTVPWWMRLVSDLDAERANRIRSQERGEIAAHLHDSVLQTLALIQKQADSPREVGRLARRQERELRDWLYGAGGLGRTSSEGRRDVTESPSGVSGGSPSGSSNSGSADIANGHVNGLLSRELACVCGEIEDAFAIKVQHVVVGECELDSRLAATLAAAREALVNAAKHAGVDEVSVYAEAEPDRLAVYVRDRGVGFAPDTVGSDRHGLAGSIRDRMRRNGGHVRLRTAPGAGTEVQMEMPRGNGQ